MKLIQNLATLAVCIIIFMALNPLFNPYDSTDNIEEGKRSGLRLYTDYGTGCQYIKGGWAGAIVPRRDRAGNHICEKP